MGIFSSQYGDSGVDQVRFVPHMLDILDHKVALVAVTIGGDLLAFGEL